MTLTQQLDRWSEKNLSAFIFGLRILLGLILLIKGFLFLFRINELTDVVQSLGMQSFNVTLALFIAWAHLLCGFLILIGLLTRLSCLLMFPILVGAVFYVNLRQGFVTSSEWIVSVVILYLTIFFFVYGSGEISLVNLFSGKGDKDLATEH
jgi:uncharacterized membrane protein YphA (DoxX/SURF4 family)